MDFEFLEGLEPYDHCKAEELPPYVEAHIQGYEQVLTL